MGELGRADSKICYQETQPVASCLHVTQTLFHERLTGYLRDIIVRKTELF